MNVRVDRHENVQTITLCRITPRDVEIAGVLIPEGSMINARWGAGNRDPRHYGDSADQIDLERPRPRSHIGFGAGVHYCIGVHIARSEMYHGLKTLMDNLERIWLRRARLAAIGC
jgi:cytochrome P450